MNRPAAVCRSAGALVVAIVLALTLGDSAGTGWADPAADALARLTEFSREAERTTEAVYAAELELAGKLGAQRRAEDRQRTELEAMTAARADLGEYQAAVNQVAAASYMGGSTSTISAALTAESPQRLLDELSSSRVMATQMSDRISAFRAASTRADEAALAAQSSALAARTAAEQASAVRADLQSKQSRLRTQIAEVEALYRALTPDQRAALAGPGPMPPAPPVPVPVPANPAIMAMPEAIPPVGPGPSSSPEGTGVAQAALTRVGAPYSWGATGPDAFDCSGLIKWAFLQNGKSLPRSSQALAAGGQPVATTDVQPGDIVTFYSDASHAGIYIGDGNMVHASTYGTPVKVAPISSAPIYNVRRY
ncbi:peptidoglycan hydrolase RipC (plasmid) [Mycolicibacterium rufum]|uniref:Peptidoglycan hydrolase RipC n=1 Tax=Mycolicibacterium rufum TaxID=318424 RepID=A0ABY3US29_9MYCO|nr:MULTISPECIES: peptidoglycan hydrolase RipC [Mycobacteriaceae]MCG7594892.1 peptidoglycan hydrolase RipC [Mycobacterium sp. PSTR-4-N]ULP39861.1 peptidoglycan hydrolase RipC [Mycolicibacterium rufum]